MSSAICLECKSEIRRAYRVLSPDDAFAQNYRDIQHWMQDHILAVEEGNILQSYNRSLYRAEAG